jgi:hypothetical protein
VTPESGLSTIPGLPETAKFELWSREILTDEEFWDRLATTPTLLSDIRFANPTEKTETLRSLGQHSATAAASVTRWSIAEHVPDILVLSVLICLVVLVAGKPVRPAPAQAPTAAGAAEQSLSIPAMVTTPLRLLQVTFPLESGSLLKELPQRIALAASITGPLASGIVVEDVYVLRVQSTASGAIAIIGASPENVAALAPYLASGKLVPVTSPAPR